MNAATIIIRQRGTNAYIWRMETLSRTGGPRSFPASTLRLPTAIHCLLPTAFLLRTAFCGNDGDS